MLLTALVGPVSALDRIDLYAESATADVRSRLAAASLLVEAARQDETAPDALLAAARADYGQLLEALYAAGHFGPEISITVDGREVSSIPPFEEPERISVITVLVRPGQRFRFSETVATPLAPDTDVPEAFQPGRVARTTTLIDTADAAVQGWRDIGFPKADVAGQDLAVRHSDAEMAARIFIDPGPRLRFGRVTTAGNSAVKTGAIRRILGWPEGELVTPDTQDKVAARLRRTGAFRSVVLREAETANPDGTLDHELLLVEEQPRRFGFGAELTTEEGLGLSAFWMHRNLTGGAERLRFEGDVSGIGGQTGGVDYGLSARLDRPGTFFPDTDLYIGLEYESLREPDFSSDVFNAEVGLRRIVSDELTVEGGLGFRSSQVTDATGTGTFRLITLPGRLTWSTVDDPLDATEGFLVDVEAMPFLGFADANSGVRTTLDARRFQKLDEDGRFVFALRGQAGSILGPDIGAVPADLRFFSGGGGTVRGQPYQSLGVDIGGNLTGGLSFAALSAEIRADIGTRVGIVGFADVGFVGETAVPLADGSFHAGGGVGLRYNTGLGPIRLDVAVPVTDSPGENLFFYVGIGHAF